MTPQRQDPPKNFQALESIDICVESGALAAREASAKFLDAIAPLKLDLEEVGTVELVLVEVLNNIVEHAYPQNGPAGPIKIHCVQQSDGLILKISDRGSAMPDGKTPLGEPATMDVELEDMPEGGFGWFLIQHLAKDVKYDRVGDENQLKMRLAVGCKH